MSQKVVGYIRVSSKEQLGEDKFGLAIQREEIEQYCAANGYDLVRIYADEGVSGALLDRPALNEMLSNNDYDRVVIAKYDRLSRDLFGQLFIEKELQVKDVELTSIREDFAGMPEDTRALMRQIVGSFAEFEKKRIAQRLASGRAHKRKQGGFAGGRAPLGYVSERGSKRLHLNGDKADTVRLIFALRTQGLTYTAIADRLNADGHTTQINAVFTPTQVKRVIDREDLYRGKLEAPGIL
jgi:site-specific DNA recombinase